MAGVHSAAAENSTSSIDDAPSPTEAKDSLSGLEKRIQWRRCNPSVWLCVTADNRGSPSVGAVAVGLAFSFWAVYIAVAMALNFNRAWPLGLATFLFFANYFSSLLMPLIRVPLTGPRTSELCRWSVLTIFGAVVLVIVGLQVMLDHPDRMHRMQSACGLSVFMLVSVLMSRKPRNIDWRLVLSGVVVQFFIGAMILRTSHGYAAFRRLGDSVSTLLDYSDTGAEFVFGSGFREHFIAFKVLPTIVYFSAIISVMNYAGVLQAVVRFLASILRILMGTSLVESVSTAGNIFLGQTEAPLLVRPFLMIASPSEVHCIMTGGFGTIAGGVLAAYIAMGISAEQLIAASVMSAPAALVVSKIMVPSGAMEDENEADETEESEATASVSCDDHFEFPTPEEHNIVEAVYSGASVSIGLVANIAAMLIAFLSVIALLDGVLAYLGDLVDIRDLSFSFLCGYLFTPVAWLLGTPAGDCFQVAQLIGTKIFANEFVAYNELSQLIEGPSGRQISERAELMATYALCGFSNFGSVGVQLGGLTALCPSRRPLFSRLVMTAMIGGNVACFLTATVAGILL
mmetsp:Transcript_95452/g.269891  ORF Transcript_95452/g.269891 Transcript_95452/m.269891 type:complete len:571 (+) Transcript_95452:2-1714(+)